MKKIISLLQSIGFSQYEAQVYLALLQQANVTGYELAKISGVPASKIYAILNRLEAKEMIQTIDSEPKKYIPQPPQDILSRIKGNYLQAVNTLTDKLEEIYVETADNNHIFNISGRTVIIRKVLDCIAEARQSLWLSVWDEEVEAISKALHRAQERGVKISIVHFGQKKLRIGKEYRHGREHQIRIERGGRRIALIVDDNKVILGHFLENGSSTAAWTTNKGLVLLAKDYVIHDIYSIRVIQKYGQDAEDIFELG